MVVNARCELFIAHLNIPVLRQGALLRNRDKYFNELDCSGQAHNKSDAGTRNIKLVFYSGDSGKTL
jgi:hypothetical protein